MPWWAKLLLILGLALLVVGLIGSYNAYFFWLNWNANVADRQPEAVHLALIRTMVAVVLVPFGVGLSAAAFLISRRRAGTPMN